jgi:hypothetical protein
MGVTKLNAVNTGQTRIYQGTTLPTTPQQYYGTGIGDVDSITWRGGEMAYLSNIKKLFIQTATSGTTASWYRYQDVLVAV